MQILTNCCGCCIQDALPTVRIQLIYPKFFIKTPPAIEASTTKSFCAFNQNPDGYRLKFQQLFECTHDGREDQINCPIIKP